MLSNNPIVRNLQERVKYPLSDEYRDVLGREVTFMTENMPYGQLATLIKSLVDQGLTLHQNGFGSTLSSFHHIDLSRGIEMTAEDYLNEDSFLYKAFNRAIEEAAKIGEMPEPDYARLVASYKWEQVKANILFFATGEEREAELGDMKTPAVKIDDNQQAAALMASLALKQIGFHYIKGTVYIDNDFPGNEEAFERALLAGKGMPDPAMERPQVWHSEYDFRELGIYFIASDHQAFVLVGALRKQLDLQHLLAKLCQHSNMLFELTDFSENGDPSMQITARYTDGATPVASLRPFLSKYLKEQEESPAAHIAETDDVAIITALEWETERGNCVANSLTPEACAKLMVALINSKMPFYAKDAGLLTRQVILCNQASIDRLAAMQKRQSGIPVRKPDPAFTKPSQ